MLNIDMDMDTLSMFKIKAGSYMSQNALNQAGKRPH